MEIICKKIQKDYLRGEKIVVLVIAADLKPQAKKINH